MAEREPLKLRAKGSIPLSPTNFKEIQMYRIYSFPMANVNAILEAYYDSLD
jgi:hypothetical protein